MQKEMIEQIEHAGPEFMVFVNHDLSWLMKPKSGRYIFEWLGRYVKQNYDITGVAEMLSSETTIYRWDDLPADYKPVSEFWLTIYRKRGNQATYQTGDELL